MREINTQQIVSGSTDSKIGDTQKPSIKTIKILKGLSKKFNVEMHIIKERFINLMKLSTIQISDVESESELKSQSERQAIRILIAEITNIHRVGYVITQLNDVIYQRSLIHKYGSDECFTLKEGEVVVGIISEV